MRKSKTGEDNLLKYIILILILILIWLKGNFILLHRIKRFTGGKHRLDHLNAYIQYKIRCIASHSTSEADCMVVTERDLDGGSSYS